MPTTKELTPAQAAAIDHIHAAAALCRQAEETLTAARAARLRAVRKEAATLAGIGWTRAARELGGLIGPATLRNMCLGLTDAREDQS